MVIHNTLVSIQRKSLSCVIHKINVLEKLLCYHSLQSCILQCLKTVHIVVLIIVLSGCSSSHWIHTICFGTVRPKPVRQSKKDRSQGASRTSRDKYT